MIEARADPFNAISSDFTQKGFSDYGAKLPFTPTFLISWPFLTRTSLQNNSGHKAGARRKQMKYVKMLGLLAVAAAALMAFAGVASATTLTSPAGTKYTGAITAVTEGHAVLENTSLGAKIECAGTTEGTVGAEHGNEEAAVHPTFSGCTNSWHVTTIAGGKLKAVSNGNGTADLFSSGATISTTRLGITCNYVTAETTVGTLTGGKPATMHINGAIPIHSGSSALCGTGKSHWKGAYEVTNPTELLVD